LGDGVGVRVPVGVGVGVLVRVGVGVGVLVRVGVTVGVLVGVGDTDNDVKATSQFAAVHVKSLQFVATKTSPVTAGFNVSVAEGALPLIPL
jgi:hypothetical protein